LIGVIEKFGGSARGKCAVRSDEMLRELCQRTHCRKGVPARGGQSFTAPKITHLPRQDRPDFRSEVIE
jgi:hypothetical protein